MKTKSLHTSLKGKPLISLSLIVISIKRIILPGKCTKRIHPCSDTIIYQGNNPMRRQREKTRSRPPLRSQTREAIAITKGFFKAILPAIKTGSGKSHRDSGNYYAGWRKTPDPELAALLGQLDSGKLTGRQANWVRQELLGYWTERLHKAHSALMEHYSHVPAIAKN